MATVSTCDRCQRQLTNLTRWMKLKSAFQWVASSIDASEPDIDLCGTCYDSLMSGFKSFADSKKELK